jgi:hypothetical protein
MQTAELKAELFYLVAYMITGARGLYDEPPEYGTFRLLDASGRLLEIMQTGGWLDPFLARLKEEVDEEREGEMDDARQRQRLDQWVVEIAHEMQQRLTNSS